MHLFVKEYLILFYGTGFSWFVKWLIIALLTGLEMTGNKSGGESDLTAKEAGPLLGPIGSTYGKVIYFQKPEDKWPIGEPYILVVQDLPEQD